MGLFWNTNDYNLILEKILDSKYFSSNSKSLLLSMIYKIENFYDDYKIVKNISKTKEKYLQDLIEIIKKYCDNIKLVEPDSKDAKLLKENNVLALTNEKERSILAYPTEISLLYAISDVIPKYFYVPSNFIIKNSLQQILVNGYNENNLEILSDFNGWSWDINTNVKHNIEDNLIYQNLIILFGLEFMDNWMCQNDMQFNSLEYIQNNLYDTKYFEYLCKYLNSNINDKEKFKLDKNIEKKMKELDEISDKPKFFETVKIKKMRYLKELEKLDIILNDKISLRNEFLKENQKLSDDRKFSSMASYKRFLIQKRESCLEKVNRLGKVINPINYINHKRELELEIRNYTPNIESQEEILILLQLEFVKVLDIRIEESDDIDELKDLLYKIRYYKFIYFNQYKQIKDINKIENEIEIVDEKLIKKLCENEVLRRICKSDKINSEIINNVLDTKIMNFKEIKFSINYKDGNLQVRTYEKEVFEKEFTVFSEILKKDILIKQNKIVKLFL